jgi:hypothetical protein
MRSTLDRHLYEEPAVKGDISVVLSEVLSYIQTSGGAFAFF